MRYGIPCLWTRNQSWARQALHLKESWSKSSEQDRLRPYSWLTLRNREREMLDCEVERDTRGHSSEAAGGNKRDGQMMLERTPDAGMCSVR